MAFVTIAFIAGQLPAADGPAVLRRPVALAATDDGRWLYVANHEAGSVSVVDLEAKAVTSEWIIGKRLSDLVFLPDGERLLACDELGHEVILLRASGKSLEVVQRLNVSPYPVSLRVVGEGRVAVASLWSRRLTLVKCDSELAAGGVIDLPFAPRALAPLQGGQRLVVADGFGGKLAIVNLGEQRVEAVRDIPGHNLRGLGTSADGQMLLVAQQMLNDLAHSIRNDIHWGLLMSNDLRWLKVESFLAGGERLYEGGHMHPLGDAGRGGGDPGGLDVAADGTVIVTISGVNQVAFGREGDFSMQHVKVGRRPTAVKFAADGRTAFAACTHDDSVCVLDIGRGEVTATISLGTQPELSPEQQGELLFYDARLSHDGWMSCHSCHTDGHTNSQMNDNFSDRSFGAAKRVLSLLSVKDTLPLGWTGQVQSFARQIHNSVENTMQRDETLPAAEVEAIAAYLKTLELPPPVGVLRGTSDAKAIELGRVIFERHDCGSCHAAPSYTTPAVYNVGLRDSQGLKEFNPPSLRGLSHRGPYFHDSSAATLSDVLVKFGHPIGTEIPPLDLADLVEFLNSL